MRLFIALPVPAEAAAFIWRGGEHLRRMLTRVTWVRQENLHITLQFLGEVAERPARSLDELFDSGVLAAQCFEVGYRGPEGFPRKNGARTIVAVLAEGVERCVSYYERLRGNLIARGFTPDARFTPHITIGRARERSGVRLENWEGKLPDGRFVVDRCVLFESILTARGPVYRPVRSISLSPVA